jgi:hypothetical protein
VQLMHKCRYYMAVYGNFVPTNLTPGVIIPVTLAPPPLPNNLYTYQIMVRLYSIQHYVIKFVSDLRQVSGFLRVLRFPQSGWNKVTVNSHVISAFVH